MAPKLEDYLALVDIKGKQEFEQIKRLLFFITVIACIRNDMTAKVIASRLGNFGVDIDEKAVAVIFIESDWDRSSPINDDRQPDEKAYFLHPDTIKQLDKEADELWDTFLSKRNPFTRLEYVFFYSTMSFLMTAALIILVIAFLL
jgi:hypothetical protein